MRRTIGSRQQSKGDLRTAPPAPAEGPWRGACAERCQGPSARACRGALAERSDTLALPAALRPSLQGALPRAEVKQMASGRHMLSPTQLQAPPPGERFHAAATAKGSRGLGKGNTHELLGSPQAHKSAQP